MDQFPNVSSLVFYVLYTASGLKKAKGKEDKNSGYGFGKHG
jgi:hypothetical protein